MNWSAVDNGLVPPGVVTVMSTVPAPCGGVDAVTVPLPMLAVNGTDVPPIVTDETPVTKLPPMVSLVPPEVPPVFGLTDVTCGRGDP